MFGFKLWSRFGSFRDPITITQNLTLPIPPKTTIGGMLASILGIDYNNYFNDPSYFDFLYTIILDNDKAIQKKSFSQNYVEDYTKNSENKFNAFCSFIKKETNFVKESSKIEASKNSESVENKNTQSDKMNLEDDILKKMTKPKPIYRELLINPSYYIFIDQYKYETEIIEKMQKHYSSFSLYMGNSEFPANYEYIQYKDFKPCSLDIINSFTQNLGIIKFENDKKYSTVYFATKVVTDRQYREYKKIVICDKPISFTRQIQGYQIILQNKEINCEFI